MGKFLIVGSVIATLFLAGCATPVTTLKNKKTGEVVQCGGGYTASIAGGVMGYDIQRDKDAGCVGKYLAAGYEPI